MAGKRKTTTRAAVTTGQRGRPRRNTRSAYATSPAEDDTRADAQGQPSEPQDREIQDPETQPNLATATEQELQQLQAQLQRAQQERDRMAAAFAANQQAIQASAQAAEIRQQLAVLHAEMLSMQHAVPATTSAIPASAATPTAAMLQGSTPVISQPTMPSQVMRRPIDPKSPLSEGIQQSPWPTAYKPITLPKFNRKTDPHQFIMSYEAAVASAGLAKSFVIAVEGDALAWYSMLKPSIVYS